MNIELPPPSAHAAAVIRMVRVVSEHDAAATAASEISLHQHHSLNAAELSMATHVMARALIIHTTLQGAAAFIASNTNTSLPDAWRAVLDLALNLPVEFDTTEIHTS